MAEKLSVWVGDFFGVPAKTLYFDQRKSTKTSINLKKKQKHQRNVQTLSVNTLNSSQLTDALSGGPSERSDSL